MSVSAYRFMDFGKLDFLLHVAPWLIVVVGIRIGLYLPLIGIILRWGFLIWELIYCKSPEKGQRWNLAET